MKKKSYLSLKENFIVHQTPKVDWLVDLEKQKNYRLSDLESSLFEMLDGSRTSEDIIKLISKNNLLNIHEIEKVKKNISDFLTSFAFAINEEEEKHERDQIYYGEKGYILPSEVGIELTDKCILSCMHCYKECCPENNIFLNFEKLLQFLSQIVGKVCSIQITGGEAMLHPHFFEILEYCKKRFKKVYISTTGALINEYNAKKFEGTHVYLSLYSLDANENDWYSGGNIYSKVINAIELLKKYNVHVCVNTIVNERNKDVFSEFVERMAELGVQGVGAGSVSKIGRGKHMAEEEYCRKESERLIADIERKFDKKGMYLSTFAEKEESEHLHCGLHKWFVNERGKILPCTFFPAEKFTIGTIEDELDKVFSYKKFDEMKHDLKQWGKLLGKEGIQLCEVCGALKELESDSVV